MQPDSTSISIEVDSPTQQAAKKVQIPDLPCHNSLDAFEDDYCEELCEGDISEATNVLEQAEFQDEDEEAERQYYDRGSYQNFKI